MEAQTVIVADGRLRMATGYPMQPEIQCRSSDYKVTADYSMLSHSMLEAGAVPNLQHHVLED
jgi:hypothetical protein